MRLTYFLGAGASVDTLPLGRQLASHVRSLPHQQWVPSSEFDYGANFPVEIKIDADWLDEQAGPHFSVDTLARKFFFTNQDHGELVRLKRIVGYYFLYTQWGRQAANPKYDALVATLLDRVNGQPALPQNVNIVTWNYDAQTELALMRFLDLRDYDELLELMWIVPATGRKAEYRPGLLNLVKLNGTAGLYTAQGRPNDLFHYFSMPRTSDALRQILDVYRKLHAQGSEIDYHLNFAWEDTLSVTDTLETARSVFSETDVLVIIGYSFPPFNRKTDKHLLESATKLRHIYVQAPRDAVRSVIGRLKALLGGRAPTMTPVTEVDQFHIPYEYM